MTHIHYKFSSKLSYDTVVFDGPHITLRDLKKQIMSREKLRASDCDLQITNAQTKEEYTDDEGLIPKGSSVIVRRIPIIGVKSSSHSKTRNTERSDVPLQHAFGAIRAMDDQSSSRALPLFSKMANLADADVSEEDKIKVMINQSTYDSMNYNKKFGAVLPTNYTCYRCGNTGHHIRNCPNSGQDKNFEGPLRLKKSTGIPRSLMVEVDDPNIKGAMLTNCGHYAIPVIHAKAYAIGKKEKPPFVLQEQPKSEEKEDPVPDELLCLICRDLLSDAVVIPCCGNSYCDDCIRNTLLDSEEHVCPTCSQSDVSPDTLIANKFLRQAVNTFKKERGHAKSLRGSCGASQSQNPTQTQSPVPTLPPLTMQSQPQKLYQSTHSQQDPLLHHSQAADTPSSSQVCGAPPTATGPAPASNTPNTSLQTVQSHLEISDKEAEQKTHDESAAAAPSVLVSHKDPTAAPSQLIPLVNQTPEVEQQQPVSVNLQQSPSGPAPRHSGPPTCWDSSSSSSGCPTGGWSESTVQQLPPSSSSSSYPPPLFPSPLFHSFLAAQQPLTSYPPGYPHATPVWTLPAPQGSPIPSLCSSASASSIPTFIPKEWYMHQRKKKERSPHRGSTYRRSSSRSNSKSSKSKSSRSYSRSSSRSRSRSRSHGRSRPRSPYSRHGGHHSHSRSSQSYSYGYKRCPTPSSSSSPRVGYRSRSKSPSSHRKNSHHGRHRSKKSASSSTSSRRRGEHSQSEAGGSGRRLASYLYAQHAPQTSSAELDRERYLQWKKKYKAWCEKYFNSYVGHFPHLSPSLLELPPTPFPQWGDREGSNSANSESHNRLQGRHTAQMDGSSPPSQSSSDSRSPPSHSSSDSRSTPSQSCSDSHSSPSHLSNDSRSPPSQSSSDGSSTPSENRAPPRGYQQRCAEKYSRLPVTLTKGSKEVELQGRGRDDKQLIARKLEKLSTLKHEQKITKRHEEGRGEESSTPDAADSTDDCTKDKRSHNNRPNVCKDDTQLQDKATASEAFESVQPLVKPDKRLDKEHERKSREQRNLETEKGWRRGKYSDSRQDVERQHKEKPSKRAGRVDTDRYGNPGGSKASESTSEKNRKRKGEDMERSSVKAHSSKTKIAEVPETCKSKSPNPFDRKKPKMEKIKEKKMWPLTERDIWEGGIKVKPQKKICININLDGKKKEEKTEKTDSSYLESITGKPKEEIEKTGCGEEEKLNRGEGEVNEKKESSRDHKSVSEEKIKPDEQEARTLWMKANFRDDEREIWEKVAIEKKDVGEKKDDKEEEDFDLWHCALRGVEEEKKESKNQWEERDGMEAGKGEGVTNDERRSVMGGKNEERRVRNDGGGQEMRELAADTQKDMPEGESISKENRGNSPGKSKPRNELMERVTWRMRKEEEDTTRSKSERSRYESHHDRSNTTADDGRSYNDHQERKTVVKTLQDYSQDRAADREDGLVLVQVPRCKWEKEESEEEEQDEGGIKVQTDALAANPSSSVSATTDTPPNRGTEGENEQQRQRSHDTERRDRQRGGVQGSNKSSSCPGGKSSSGRSWEGSSLSRAAELPDQNAHKTYRDMFLDLKCKEKDQPHYYYSPQDPSRNYRHQDRPAGIHHSPPARSHSSSGRSELSKSRMSSHGWELMQNRSRNESKVEKGEWKRNKMDKVIKEGKQVRGSQDMVAEREGGGRRESKADKLDGQTKWVVGRELEEGERPSSSTNSANSSASQESSSDDRRKEWKKKQKKHKKEKRAPELLEEGELKKHKHKKKSKKSRDGGEEESSGEVDDRWKEEKDHAKLCSVTLF